MLELQLKNSGADILLDALGLRILNLDTESRKGVDDILVVTSSKVSIKNKIEL